MYEPRYYRCWTQATDLVSFRVVVRETDLYIAARTNLKRKALRLATKYRRTLEQYIAQQPGFLTATEPLPLNPEAPQIVATMLRAARETGVGPMAAVAGAIAGAVGADLLPFSPEVIVENGGDIYLRSLHKRVIGIYAGDSPLSGMIGVEVVGDGDPVGVCTSSGTVGHSLSYGRADAVITIAPDTTLADAAATAIGNLVQGSGDIELALKRAKTISGLRGAVIIVGREMGAWGDIRLCETAGNEQQGGFEPLASR